MSIRKTRRDASETLTVRTRAHPRRRTSSRGFTFLEAVLAAALLGIVAGGVLGAIGWVWNMELRNRRELAAAEIANRVVIAYLDDATSLRDLPRVIYYENEPYRWKADRQRVSLQDANPNARVGPDGRRQDAGTIFQELVSLRVTAWHDDGSAGAFVPGSAPSASIDRIVNPLDFASYDSLERLLEDPDRINLVTRGLLGIGAPEDE